MSNSGRLLVVEDQDTERRAISQVLRIEGYTVFAAENADKAMGYIDESIDVVLSDLYMGDVSGLDLLQLWKKKQPETQFILLTGHSSIDSAVEAIKAGAYDYITKPVNPDELSSADPPGHRTHAEGPGDRQPAPPAGPEVRPGPDRRPVAADEGGLRQDPAGRPGGQHGADPRRKRNGQGTGRPGAAPQQPAEEGPVRRRQLRRGAGDPRRKRAVRPCPRRVHRRHRPPHRPLRAGRRRNAVHRRNRRLRAGTAGQAPARAGDASPSRRSAATKTERSTSACWQPPAAISARWSRTAPSARTCSTG